MMFYQKLFRAHSSAVASRLMTRSCTNTFFYLEKFVSSVDGTIPAKHWYELKIMKLITKHVVRFVLGGYQWQLTSGVGLFEVQFIFVTGSEHTAILLDFDFD